MKRWNVSIVLLLGLAMTLGACGGGETTPPESPATTTGDSTDTPDPTDASSDSTPADEAGDSTEASVARVTLDGTVYEFGMFGPATRCVPDQFGGFWVIMRTEDLGGSFGAELWPDGGTDRVNQANMTITVDGVYMDLTANPTMEANWPAVEAGTSLVQSFQIDGNKASGTASFIDDEVAYDSSLFPLDPIIADFEVVCGSDG
jgi:hypothetical protein